jgi:hypothetical protein
MEFLKKQLSPGYEKVNEYAERIRNGEDPAQVMQGLKSIFRDSIEKRVFELEQQDRFESVDNQVEKNIQEKSVTQTGFESDIFIPSMSEQEYVLREQQKQERLIEEKRQIEELKRQLGMMDKKNQKDSIQEKRESFEKEKNILELIKSGEPYTFKNLSNILPFNNQYIENLLSHEFIKNIESEDIRIVFSDGTLENKVHAGGWFDSVTNTIIIQKSSIVSGYEKVLQNEKRGGGKYENMKSDSFNEYLQTTITHELIHSVTAVITNMDKVTIDGKNNFLSESQLKSITELKRVLKDIQALNLEEYGTENIDELLAEIANNNFLEKLNQFPDPENPLQSYKDTLLKQFEVLVNNPIKNPYFKQEERQKLIDKIKISNS